MPALADILLKHAQYKQRAKDNAKGMAQLWAEAFDTFIVEISHAIDVKIEATMKSFCNEAKDNHGALGAADSSRGLKRQRSEEHLRSTSSGEHGTAKTARTESEDLFAGIGQATREQKRRRFDPPLESWQKSRVIQTEVGLQSSAQSEIQDILSQMKLKIDEQAQSLQKLAKENNKVGAWVPTWLTLKS
jgi:hypothetical protein